MSYCDIDDVAKKLKDVTTAQVDGETVISPSIEYADEYIDSYLNEYYIVPFDGIPPRIIKHLSIRLAAAESLRTVFQDKSDEMSTVAKEWREEVMDTLRKIQEREMSILGRMRIG